MIRRLMFITLIVFVLSVSSASAFWRSNTWQSPSTNIICRYIPGAFSMKCMTRNDEFTLVLPAYSKAYVGSDYGIYVSVPTSSPILRYGQYWVSYDGKIRCLSRLTGVTCRNLRSDHGFFISRQSYRVW